MDILKRRAFLRQAGMATAGALVSATAPLGRWTPYGFVSSANAASAMPVEGKYGLVVLNDRPLSAETPAHLLDDEVTPTERHFIRNNGIVPTQVDPEGWTLRIDGLVERPMTLSIRDLRDRFEVVTYRLLLECGGNGRARFDPPARGNQWTYGAVACAEWTGVRLSDVLDAAGVMDTAIYTAHEGADIHLSGATRLSDVLDEAGVVDRAIHTKQEGADGLPSNTPRLLPISRGLPIEKAMDPYNLIAFEMNGGPLHPMNGAPLRLVVPGWPGSCSHKWLTRIWLRDVIHDGAKMTGASYRVPRYPVAPGDSVPDEDMEIIHAMPVKSLITLPETGLTLAGRELRVAGHAWAGDTEVARVDLSTDYGASWQEARLARPHNPHAWQRFTARVRFPKAGYYQVWARATDREGVSQPFEAGWNPRGYLNNALHHVAVRVT